MKILDVKEQKDGGAIIDIDLSLKEEQTAYDVGVLLLPDEKDREKVVQEALLYFIIIGMINEEIQE